MRRLRCCVMRKRFSPNAVQLRDDIATLSRFRFRGPLRRLIVGRLAPVAGVGKSLGDYAELMASGFGEEDTSALIRLKRG